MVRAQIGQHHVYGCLFLAEVIFGVWPVVASMAIKEGMDPVVFCLYRCAGSALLLLTASWMTEGYLPVLILPSGGINAVKQGYLEKFRALPWSHLVLLGFLMAFNNLGYILGVAMTSSFQAALMQPIVPVVACFVGVLSGQDSASPGKLLGILASVIGAVFVVCSGKAEHHGRKAEYRYELGTLALMVHVICIAFYFVLQKVLVRKYPPIYITGISTLIAAAILVVVACLYCEEIKLPSWRHWTLTPRREAALAYGIVLTTTLNLTIMAWANKVTNPSTVTAFSTLQPLITAVLSILCFGVWPTDRTMAGGVAIIGGLLLTVRAQLSEPPPADETRLL